MFKELVYASRTKRKFYGDYAISQDILKELVDLARMCPSSMNLQPLKYYLSNKEDTNKIIFQHVKWAGYLSDWEGPTLDERPSAHIIILRDHNITKHASCDHGIAAQTIMLGAVEKGLGGCIHSAVDKKGLIKDLGIFERYEIMLVLSIGKPNEEVVIDEIKGDELQNIKYWRDENNVHHVPKRSLEDIIL